jgi:hypothetical protein
MDSIIPLLTAFGLGSIVTALIQSFLTSQREESERRFREKQSAYVGLLEAYHRAAVEGTDQAAKNFGYWQMRCELVAPARVRRAIAEIVETNDDPQARAIAHQELKVALRTDLKVEGA